VRGNRAAFAVRQR